MTNDILNKLFNKANKDFWNNGYVGLDYNMAVMCICAKRLNRKIEFCAGGESYESKLDYWARKRHFGHLTVDSEDDLLTHAIKKYKVNT
jgi:hypothetical protein